jgi:hypothetical protein
MKCDTGLSVSRWFRCGGTAARRRGGPSPEPHLRQLLVCRAPPFAEPAWGGEDERIAIHAELPGIKKEDVNVTWKDGVLKISGEKRGESEKKGRNYDQAERTAGAFQRALTLPSSVNFGEATASFKDGVLIIKMPKTEASKPHRMQIE